MKKLTIFDKNILGGYKNEENGKYYVDLTNDIVVDVKYKQKSILNPNTGGLFMILEVLTLMAIFTYSFVGVNKKKQIN